MGYHMTQDLQEPPRVERKNVHYNKNASTPSFDDDLMMQWLRYYCCKNGTAPHPLDVSDEAGFPRSRGTAAIRRLAKAGKVVTYAPDLEKYDRHSVFMVPADLDFRPTPWPFAYWRVVDSIFAPRSKASRLMTESDLDEATTVPPIPLGPKPTHIPVPDDPDAMPPEAEPHRGHLPAHYKIGLDADFMLRWLRWWFRTRPEGVPDYFMIRRATNMPDQRARDAWRRLSCSGKVRAYRERRGSRRLLLVPVEVDKHAGEWPVDIDEARRLATLRDPYTNKMVEAVEGDDRPSTSRGGRRRNTSKPRQWPEPTPLVKRQPRGACEICMCEPTPESYVTPRLLDFDSSPES